jgi:hypothetical protein
MAARSELRKQAYKYILNILGSLSDSPEQAVWSQCIPLEELRLIKEGVDDPSPALVSLLKEIVRNSMSESEIDAHLVTPFEKLTPAHQKSEITRRKRHAQTQ